MKDRTILKIRKFNRFYLSVMDFYENSYLDSDYSVTESRVLYEIYENEECIQLESAMDTIREMLTERN